VFKRRIAQKKKYCGVAISVHKYIQSNLTFQGNNEIWSHKTGGHLRQVWLMCNTLWREIKI